MNEITRKYNKIKIGEDSVRHKVQIVDMVNSVSGGIEARARFFRLLEILRDTPELAMCGDAPVADWIKIWHDGSKWVMDMEAVVKT